MKAIYESLLGRGSLQGAGFAVLTLLFGALSHGAVPLDEKKDVVIVPYDSTKPINEQQPDQFYLPYERFLRLWAAAKEHRAGVALEPAKFAYALTSARYDGVVSDRSVTFTGKLDITTTTEKWVKVPLAFESVNIGGLKIDGVAAVYDGDSIVIEKPGRHTVEATFEIPLEPGAKQFAWGIPKTSATLVGLTLPDQRTHAVITPGSGVVERIENGRSLVVAAVGATEKIAVELQTAAAATRVAEPAMVSIVTKLAVRANAEDIAAGFDFSFPGVRQDRFTIYLDDGLTLYGLDAENLKSWKLSPEAGRQALEITLNEPVTESFGVSLQAQRNMPAAAGDRVAPVFSAAAKRVDYVGTAIFSDPRLGVVTKAASGQRQIPWDDAHFEEAKLIAAYAGAGKLAYSVKPADMKREARVDYAYQVNRRKIELMASMRLIPNGDDLSTATLTLPAQFEVQAVQSSELQDWWRDGNALHLRFRGQSGAAIPLVVYLMREYAAAPTELEVRPLMLEGFKRVSGEAVIAAHKGVDVTMKLNSEGHEISPEKAAADFQILPPLERKRGFAFKNQDFSAKVALTALPAKFNGLWVMHAQAHEGWLAVSTHARLTVRQGSMDRASFTLPKSAPEARVSGGEVRETRSRVEGDQRIYEVQFQNDVFEAVEFTVDLELPDTEEAALPALAISGAQMTSGYVLTENASEYEMRLKTENVDPAPTTDIPFLPQLSKSAGVFRVHADWSVNIALDRLEKATARAAFVAWAEMTSALRADGTEWHRASYRLQNRSLQFLPVRLPTGAELMSARVAGQNVRADTGQVDGLETLLVPLIKTKPGDLSYDVELVYRMSGPLPGWRAKRQFLEPELPGITVERTLWNVWVPDDRKLETSGGNMETVLADLNQTEKLEGKLQELKQLVTIVNSSRASAEARENAGNNLSVLRRQLMEDNRDDHFAARDSNAPAGTPKPTPGDEMVGKKALDNQWGYVDAKRKQLNEEMKLEMRKIQAMRTDTPELKAVPRQITASSGAQWSANGAFSGKVVAATPPPTNNTGNGNLFLNDNIVLQNQEVSPRIPAAAEPITRVVQAETGGGKRRSQTLSAGEAADDRSKDVVLQNARSNNLYRQQEQQTQSTSALPSSSLMKAGSGTLAISGATAYTGSTVIAGGNTAVFPTEPNAPAAPAAPPVTLAGGITITPNPAQTDALDMAKAMQAARPPEMATIDSSASTNAPNPIVKAEVERLQPTGRISLAVDFPTEGQVYHFKKIKANAVLDLTVTETKAFERWWNFAIFLLLAGVLHGLSRVFEKRTNARIPRAEPAQ